MSTGEFWTMVSAIASAVAAIIALVSVRFVRQQVSAATDARRIEVLFKVMDELERPEIQRTRELILSNQMGGIDDPDINRVCILFDRIGLLVRENHLDRRLAFEYFPQTHDLWVRLAAFVSNQRMSRYRPHLVHFEQFAEDVRKHQAASSSSPPALASARPRPVR